MNLVQTYEDGVSFWEKNPSWTVAGTFKKFYKEDKSKDKKKSSDIMWFMVFCYDRNSHFYKLHEDEKFPIIGEDHLGDEKFYEKNEELLDRLIPEFCRALDSVGEASLRSLEQKIIERDRFINKTPYTLDRYEHPEGGKPYKVPGTAELLDKMLEKTKPIYKQLADSMKEFKDMEDQANGLGGREASLSDGGEI